ncbi:hypothetical protein GPB2148_3087 [marine gamma proteobacterium HTCC2148]|nr:hypothetical protein GPB2148_3087 [marine gamma proteobacterium HTCC2148]
MPFIDNKKPALNGAGLCSNSVSKETPAVPRLPQSRRHYSE